MRPNRCLLELSVRLLAGFFCLLSAFGTEYPEAVKFKRILLVDSYSATDSVWSGNVRKGFEDILNHMGYAVGIETFDLNIRYQPGQTPAPGDIEALRSKLAGNRYDLVVTADNTAAHLFLNKDLALPAEMPLLVSSYFGPLQIPAGADITGVETVPNQYKNLELGLKLLPDNRQVTVLFESTDDGDLHHDRFLKWSAVHPLPKGIEIRVLSGDRVSTREVLEIVSKLPPGSLLLFHSWSSSKDDIPENAYTMLPKLRERFPGLILGRYRGYIDLGATGGMVISGEEQGRQAGVLAARILQGERAGKIPVQSGNTRLVLDYPSLMRAGVKASKIPPEALLLNVPPGFPERYRKELLWVAGIVVALLLLALARQHADRKAMRKIERMFTHLPQEIGVTAPSGKILWFHGRSRNAPRHLSELPEPLRESFAEAVRATFAAGKKLELDFHRESEDRHVEFIRLPDELFGRGTVMWISSDQTELRQAHLETALLAERSRLTLESIGDAVVVTDPEQRVTLMNPVAAAMIGIDPENALGRQLDEIFNLVSYTDGKPTDSPLKRALATGKIVELANHTDLISLDGGRRYHIADSAAPVRDPDGVITGGVLVFRDVTDEYERREQLCNALTSLEYASELTDSASFRMNVKTLEVTGSKLLPQLWPVRDGKAVPHPDFIHPEDRENDLRQLNALLTRQCEINSWNYRSDFTGELRHYRIRASVNREKPDDPSLFGVVQDITEITRSAGKLKESMELWELVINSIPIMFYAKDADNDFRYALCNRAFADFHGQRREDILGRTDAELFGAKHAEYFLRQDREVMETPEGKEFTEFFADIRSLPFHCQTVKKPFRKANGKRLLLGAIQDVTELNHLIACERFNTNILACAAGESDFGRVIEHVAESLFAQIGGCRILLVRADTPEQLRMVREWRTGTVRPMDNDRLEKYYPVWRERMPELRENRIVKISDIARSEAYRPLGPGEQYEITSVIGAPVFEDNLFRGILFVSFQGPPRTFTEAEESIMRSSANVISLAWMRKTQEEKIRSHEREMHMILNNIGIPIALHAADGKLLHVNPAACRMTGLPQETLLASAESEVFYLGRTPPPDSPLKQVIAGRKSASADLEVGGRQYIIHADAVIDDGGKLVNIVKDAIDVTELNASLKNQQVIKSCLEILLVEENADKAVHSVLELIRSHFGASRSCVFRFDPAAGCCRLSSESAAPDRPKLFPAYADLPFQADDPWMADLREDKPVLLYDMEDPAQMEFTGSRKAFVKPFDMKSVFLTGIFRHGELWGDFSVIYENEPCREFNPGDIATLQASAHLLGIMLERQAARQQLLHALEQAEAAGKAKSFFIASVSHEIRTPLNSVIGFSELLRNGGVSPEQEKEFLNNIVYSGNALLQLVNDVLDLSKLEAGQMKFVPKPTDFGRLGREVMQIFRFSADKRNLELKTEIPPLPELELDAQRIRQILFNLIGNAVKFTLQGSIALRAEFRPEDGGKGTLEFSIADTGIGIAKQNQEHLMEPFVQIADQHGTNATGNGTGLGLSVSRRLAEKMGGELWLESDLGKGSIFGVTLKDVRLSPAGEQAGVSPAPETLPEANLAILAVDDVEMNLKVLKAMCARLGVTDVVTADSGAAALELLSRRHFDLVLTDLWMPEMDGFELLAGIRSGRRNAAIPVIVVTADAEVRNDFARKGFDGILLKPVTLEKLKEAIKK